MLARMSVLALCAVAALASSVAANPAGLTNAICIGRLAEALKATPVAQPILDFIEKVEAEFPYEGEQDWDELEEEARMKYFAHYPTISCNKFGAEMEKNFGPALADGCMEKLEAIAAGELSRVGSLALMMKSYWTAAKANDVCLHFYPGTDDQGQAI